MPDFDDDEVVVVGQPLPRIATVQALDAFVVGVEWHAGTRGKLAEVVDLAAALARFKLYAPLRDDPALFATARVQEHGYGIAWGDGAIDMASTTVADAADETMTAEDFAGFMDRHGFTLDRVAAELGISRRMAAYYKKQARVPRTVALACGYIELSGVRRASLPVSTADLGEMPEHVHRIAEIDRHNGDAFTVEDAKAAVKAMAAVEEAFGTIRAGMREG
jgi:hypothetical protein